MTNQIVQINVAQTLAPIPSTLQRTGAILSVGATTLGAGNRLLLTQASDLTTSLKAAAAISTLTWTANVVTATTAAPHGIPNGSTFRVTIAGATPAGYNGTFLATSTGASTFTYPRTGDPGAETVPGTWVPAATADLVVKVADFFAQGSTVAVYVFETGILSTVNAIAYLNTWIPANPNVYYSYLVPLAWADDSTFVTLANLYVSLTSKTYFFVTMTTGNYSSFAGIKSVVGLVPSPTADPTAEFSIAAEFWKTLSYDPSTTNKVTPLGFAYVLGVTAWPTSGNGATFALLKTAGVNWIGTGAEGGISNNIIFWGTNMDVRPFNYWYAVDWAQINLEIDLANEVINGSNNPLAPLYYDQNGINRLRARAQATLDRGVGFGLLLAPITVAAVPFNVYVPANQSSYIAGAYGGLSATISTARGFETITFNLNVTDIPSAA